MNRLQMTAKSLLAVTVLALSTLGHAAECCTPRNQSPFGSVDSFFRSLGDSINTFFKNLAPNPGQQAEKEKRYFKLKQAIPLPSGTGNGSVYFLEGKIVSMDDFGANLVGPKKPDCRLSYSFDLPGASLATGEILPLKTPYGVVQAKESGVPTLNIYFESTRKEQKFLSLHCRFPNVTGRRATDNDLPQVIGSFFDFKIPDKEITRF